MTADADGAVLPAAVGAPRPVGRTPPSGELVRSGAELVELSERFYRGIFVGGVIFVGLSAAAALGLLALRQSDATYATVTVVLTMLLVVVTPIAVWCAGRLYRLLRRRQAAQLALVLLAAALVMYPLRSELWWPSCALLMLIATLAPLRRTLAYCLLVLLANLAAHAIAGDLGETPPVSIIGLWIGYVFWSSAFAVFTDRLAAHVLRLNTPPPPPSQPAPRRVKLDQDGPDIASPAAADRAEDVVVSTATAGAAPPSAPACGDATGRLTARQLQVVVLLADGLRYDEVAACLAISARQVQRHVSNAIQRLGLRNTNELIAVVVADGVVPDRG